MDWAWPKINTQQPLQGFPTFTTSDSEVVEEMPKNMEDPFKNIELIRLFLQKAGWTEKSKLPLKLYLVEKMLDLLQGLSLSLSQSTECLCIFKALLKGEKAEVALGGEIPSKELEEWLKMIKIIANHPSFLSLPTADIWKDTNLSLSKIDYDSFSKEERGVFAALCIDLDRFFHATCDQYLGKITKCYHSYLSCFSTGKETKISQKEKKRIKQSLKHGLLQQILRTKKRKASPFHFMETFEKKKKFIERHTHKSKQTLAILWDEYKDFIINGYPQARLSQKQIQSTMTTQKSVLERNIPLFIEDIEIFFKDIPLTCKETQSLIGWKEGDTYDPVSRTKSVNQAIDVLNVLDNCFERTKPSLRFLESLTQKLQQNYPMEEWMQDSLESVVTSPTPSHRKYKKTDVSQESQARDAEVEKWRGEIKQEMGEEEYRSHVAHLKKQYKMMTSFYKELERFQGICDFCDPMLHLMKEAEGMYAAPSLDEIDLWDWVDRSALKIKKGKKAPLQSFKAIAPWPTEAKIETPSAPPPQKESLPPLSQEGNAFFMESWGRISKVLKEDFEMRLQKHLRIQGIQQKYLKATHQEALDHLFLYQCSLELFFSAVKKCDPQTVFFALSSAILDMHICVEQLLGIDLFFKKGYFSDSHSLVRLRLELGSEFGKQEEDFLKEMDRGVIWERYPFDAQDRYKKHKREVPPLLKRLHEVYQWVKQSKDVRKEQYLALAQDLLKMHKKLERWLCARLTLGTKEYRESSAAFQKKLLQNIEKEKSLTQVSMTRPMGLGKYFKRSSEETLPRIKDAEYHLWRQYASSHVCKNYSKERRFAALFYRAGLNWQWFYEQLFILAAKERGISPIGHSFEIYKRILGENVFSFEKLAIYNNGISRHYPRTMSFLHFSKNEKNNVIKGLLNALNYSKAHSFYEEGFKVVGQKNGEPDLDGLLTKGLQEVANSLKKYSEIKLTDE